MARHLRDPRSPAGHEAPAGAPRDHPVRVDLHVHTLASSVAGEATLRALHCPECYSTPADVYTQAIARGMDFVAITDHDTLDGALQLDRRNNVIVGEELTCYFPEDGCKIHLLLFGINRPLHDELQSRAADIYRVAELVEQRQIAHSVAHPLYRQNDKLERWHIERLILLFKGFECLNGAHSSLHRESLDSMLNELTRAGIQQLAEKHNLLPRWREPWFKARTGGSDDHGLLNVGRTWTEFPPDADSPCKILDYLREGVCQPGGEAGSSLKLAHAFYAVGVRYATRSLPPNTRSPVTRILRSLIGERIRQSPATAARSVLSGAVSTVAGAIAWPFRRKPVDRSGIDLLAGAFSKSVLARLAQHPALCDAMSRGLPPLGEHDDLFKLLASVNSDLATHFAGAVDRLSADGQAMRLFDVLSGVIAQQFVLAPYYFALFHQNKERAILPTLTRPHDRTRPLRVGLFTDTFDDINGVARFIRDMAEQARRAGASFQVATSNHVTRFEHANRTNFDPMLSREMPFYPELRLNLPPVLHMLEWADRQQFDVIHISTPGPVGLVGWLASKMLRVPTMMTYHTDFPAYVENLTRDHRLTAGCSWFMSWIYRQAAGVFSRSQAYQQNLRGLGIKPDRLLTIIPGINTDTFNASHRDPRAFDSLGIAHKRHKLLYCGRVSVEKNLPMLVEVFRKLCAVRDDVALIVGGDGPYLQPMRDALKGLPAVCLGFQSDEQLARYYASSTLFVFPSRTDTLGQVVMEAQSSGLPAIVADEGGPKETVAHDVSGIVLPASDPDLWVSTISRLLDDEPTRARFSRSALTRSARYSLAKTFEHFFAEHAKLLGTQTVDEPKPQPITEYAERVLG